MTEPIKTDKAFEKLEKKLLRQTGKAIVDYGMIEEGDRVMVCMSGGKDSWCMLHLLEQLQKRAPIRFELLAVHLDQGEPYAQSSEIAKALAEQSVPFEVVKRHLYDIVEEKLQPGQVRCSLCSRLRRGALYNIATEFGCTKIALGHHRDDLIQTLLMNQFFTGRISAMPPKLTSDDGRHVVIRPLCNVAEDDIIALTQYKQFTIFPCLSCDLQDSKRGRVKQLIEDLEAEIPDIRQSLLRSLSNVRPSQLMDRALWSFETPERATEPSSTTPLSPEHTAKTPAQPEA